MLGGSDFVPLPVGAILFVGKGVCACKRKPLRRRTACCPNSLLHPAGRFAGSPFLWVLSFGDAKKSTSPPGRDPACIHEGKTVSRFRREYGERRYAYPPLFFPSQCRFHCQVIHEPSSANYCGVLADFRNFKTFLIYRNRDIRKGPDRSEKQ